MKRVAIIGAGMAGLALARHLDSIAEVEVFEKSRGLGGRMATRKADPYQFDHGAQFFTAKTREFTDFLEPYIETGVVARWDAEFAEIDDDQLLRRSSWASGPAHYVCVPGMNSLAKRMADGIGVTRETLVSSIEAGSGSWRLFDQHGKSLGQFDWVISAVPAAQTIGLLPETFKQREAIQQKKMLGCYSLMLGFEQDLPLDWQAAFVGNANISWISNDNSKPGRPPHYSLLVHSTNRWAQENLELEQADVTALLVRELERVLRCDVSGADHVGLHRWRFANIEKQTGERFYIDSDLRLAAIGDWCIQGRIEAAFVSASELARVFKDLD